MKAVVYPDYGVMPELTEVPEPACPPDGAVIAVGATGLCRSDWHAWRWHDPVALPHIPGHELAGVVARTGPEVRAWRVGDRVTVPFVCGCGRCEHCLAGDAQVCPDQTQPGFTGPGSFAERVAVHAADANLVALPDAVGFVTAACLGCRFATAFRAITAHGRPRPGDWLAVHGCGGVGLSAVMIAVALGVRVVAADVSEPALDRARQLGAAITVRAGRAAPADGADAPGTAGVRGIAAGPGITGGIGLAADAETGGGAVGAGTGGGGIRDGSADAGLTGAARTAGAGGIADGPGVKGGTGLGDEMAAAIIDATNGGAHVSIDAFGSPGTAMASVRCLRRRGRHVQVGLLLGQASTPPIPMDLVVARELEIYGCHGMPARDYPPMMSMIADGTLRPDLLLGRVIGLNDAAAALAAMDEPAGNAGMTVIEVGQP